MQLQPHSALFYNVVMLSAIVALYRLYLAGFRGIRRMLRDKRLLFPLRGASLVVNAPRIAQAYIILTSLVIAATIIISGLNIGWLNKVLWPLTWLAGAMFAFSALFCLCLLAIITEVYE